MLRIINHNWLILLPVRRWVSDRILQLNWEYPSKYTQKANMTAHKLCYAFNKMLLLY